MPKNENLRASRPAPAPLRKDQQALEDLRASIGQLVVAVNGALNITSASLQNRMDRGFQELKELIESLRP